MKRKDDPYITFLKYAREKMREGKPPHFTEVYHHVYGLHPELRQDAFQNIFFQAMDNVAGQEGIGASYESRIKNKLRHILTLESYFQLLEHEELEQARLSSTKALGVATWALTAAVVAMVITLLVAAASFIVPIFDPTTVEIESGQISEIKQLIESHE